MSQAAQAAINLIRSKTDKRWWEFHGPDVIKAIEAVAEEASKAVQPCQCQTPIDLADARIHITQIR